MKTFAELKAQGFTFSPASRAIDCTEVRFGAKFWVVRQRTVTQERAMYAFQSVSAAIEDSKGSYLIFAGEARDSDVCPFVFLTEEEHEQMAEALAYAQKCAERVIQAKAAEKEALLAIESVAAKIWGD